MVAKDSESRIGGVLSVPTGQRTERARLARRRSATGKESPRRVVGPSSYLLVLGFN